MKNFLQKIQTKIRAIFNVGGTGFAVDLKSAEVKPGKICLHPVDQDVTYVIKNRDVDILINNGEEISEDDFFIINNGYLSGDEKEKQKTNLKPKEINTSKEPVPRSSYSHQSISPYFIKKKITFTFYGDELDWVNQTIKNSGMQRSDYLIACLQNAQRLSSTKRFVSECERVKKQRDKHSKEVKEYYKLR